MTRTDEPAAALTLGRTVRLAKALAHPTRLRVLGMLRGGELCACQLTAALGLAPSTVSGHLGELRRAGLVREDKRGRWVHYRLAGSGPAAAVWRQLLEELRHDPQLASDAVLIGQLRRHTAAELCEAGGDLAALGVASESDGAAA